tara:strand:+ start:453 stop:1781 length:1329 start_codon:yes stop_codon:yes gene_type:complete
MSNKKKVDFAFTNLPINEPDIAGGNETRKMTTYGDNADKNDTNSNLATVKTAKLYIYGWLYYNACFPCLPNTWCSNKFCFDLNGGPFIELRRSTWLRLLHGLCFLLHTAFAVVTLIVSNGNDMLVTIKRIRPFWGPGSDYFHDIQPSKNQFVYMDVLTLLFFACSAVMHGMWVFLGNHNWANRVLWNYLDNCLCWWRWAEYSLSASIMMISIAITTGIADQNTLLGIFALGFVTMWCGFFTELVSRPARNAAGKVDYDRWEGDPNPLSEEDKRGPKREQMEREHLRARIANYGKRMFPHIIGIIPYSAAWFMIINGWTELMDDLNLCDEVGEGMPDFVPYIVYGCFTVFSFFTFVQWRYQWTAPKHYWRTELWYCVLSATSKIMLGLLLFMNVLSKTVRGEEYSRCTYSMSVEEACNQTVQDLRIANTQCERTPIASLAAGQ